MKKIFSTMLVVAALLMAMPAKAQFTWGVRAGLNLTQLSINESLLDPSNRAGFYVGPTVKFHLPLIGLGFDASAVYDQRNAKVGEESLDAKSIALPINARYSIGLGSMANVFFFAGPQFAFNVGSDKTGWEWKSSNISVNLGVGATVLSHLEAKVNYNIACGKTGEFTLMKGVTSGINGKYNSWQIGLGYYF